MIRPRVNPFFRPVITVLIIFTFFCFIIQGKAEVTSILKAEYRSDLIKAEEPLFINVLRSTLKMLQRAKLGIKKVLCAKKKKHLSNDKLLLMANRSSAPVIYQRKNSQSAARVGRGTDQSS